MMTDQEVFDTVWFHLNTQKTASYDVKYSECRYNFDGLKCAAGVFLTEDQAKRHETKSWKYVVGKEKSLSSFTENQVVMVREMQHAHDTAAMKSVVHTRTQIGEPVYPSDSKNRLRVGLRKSVMTTAIDADLFMEQLIPQLKRIANEYKLEIKEV